MNFFLRQRWRDERLAHNESGLPVLELHHLAINEVWLPDIYFVNEKTAHFHYVSVPNKMFNVFPDGRVSYSVRLVDWYIVLSPIKNLHLSGDVTIWQQRASKFRPLVGAYGLWGKGSYAETLDLGFFFFVSSERPPYLVAFYGKQVGT